MVSFKHHFEFIGKTCLFEKEMDKAYLDFLLDKAGLRQEYLLLSRALSELLELPADSEEPEDVPRERLSVLKKDLFSISSLLGFVTIPTAGNRMARRAGIPDKLLFLAGRLFPSLKVLRAATGHSSTIHSFYNLPSYMIQTLQNYTARKKKGVHLDIELSRDKAGVFIKRVGNGDED